MIDVFDVCNRNICFLKLLVVRSHVPLFVLVGFGLLSLCENSQRFQFRQVASNDWAGLSIHKYAKVSSLWPGPYV